MEKKIRALTLIVICLWVLWAIVPLALANADQGLRYSCSAQVYEAFENTRLDAFTRKPESPLTCLSHHQTPVCIG